MFLPSAVQIFSCAFLASLVTTVYGVILNCERAGRFLERYQRPWFWVLRLVLACLAGAIVVVAGVTEPSLAIYMGVTLPIVLYDFWQQRGMI